MTDLFQCDNIVDHLNHNIFAATAPKGVVNMTTTTGTVTHTFCSTYCFTQRVNLAFSDPTFAPTLRSLAVDLPTTLPATITTPPVA